MKKLMRFSSQSGGRLIVLAAAALVAMPVGALRAETCPRERLDQAIDGAGEALRKLKAEQTPRIQAKIRELRVAKGWSEAEAEERAYAAAQDKRLQQLDGDAAQLLQKIDQIGALDAAAKTVDCARVADATAAGAELQATVRARTQYLISRFDGILGDGKASDGKGAESKAAAVAAPKPAAPAVSSAPVVQQKPLPPPEKGTVEPGPGGPQKGWNTDVTASPAPVPQGAPLPESQTAPVGPAASEAGQGYSIEEIAAAAKGVFGKASANLAGILEQTFAKSGRPTGYIIGTEAGGAFIAGVRYGKGTLVLRTGESIPIFWHGPSIGAELGASGSEVLFLVYKLADAEDIFTTFNGVEGSAYAVGGFGGTFLSNGRVQMAPIRAGVGLRLGANIGYTRFTRKQTWNPF